MLINSNFYRNYCNRNVTRWCVGRRRGWGFVQPPRKCISDQSRLLWSASFLVRFSSGYGVDPKQAYKSSFRLT